MKYFIAVALAAISFGYCDAQTKSSGFALVDKRNAQQVDVLYNGKLLTSYCYYDSVRKPFLFPVNTIDGIAVTRGYPITPLPGERVDHPHHTGIWMNYESVNGLDFWNNSTAIPLDKRHLYGTIKHSEITNKKTSGNKAMLTATAGWISPDGVNLLSEITTYEFIVSSNKFFIDRQTTLTANEVEVKFKDVKDGFFAIRVARELEQPSQQADVFVDAHGNETKVPKVDNTGVSGRYIASNGLQGDSVWSSKGKWTTLKGKKKGKHITIGIIDHPGNLGYPTYWHARGYGLFAANPLGRKVFSNGREELNFALHPKQSVTFNYRVVIASSDISNEQMNQLAKEFARTKRKK